jgi:hypothetical protein
MAVDFQPLLPGLEQQAARSRRGRPATPPVDHGKANRNEVHDAGEPRHAGDRARILAHLAAVGSHGATRDEIAVALLLPITTVSARCTWLKRNGYLCELPERRPTRTGSSAVVCVLSRYGRAAG